jgi:hypothetical protein
MSTRKKSAGAKTVNHQVELRHKNTYFGIRRHGSAVGRIGRKEKVRMRIKQPNGGIESLIDWRASDETEQSTSQ